MKARFRQMAEMGRSNTGLNTPDINERAEGRPSRYQSRNDQLQAVKENRPAPNPAAGHDDRVAKAGAIREDFYRFKENLEADLRLTDAAKREEIAARRDAANQKLRELYETDVAAIDTELVALDKHFFAAPALSHGATASDSIARDASYRDALARARGTENGGGLIAMYRDAERTGDWIMARAAMAIAVDRGDLQVLDAWLATHPLDEPKLQRLLDLTTAKHSTSRALAIGLVFQGV